MGGLVPWTKYTVSIYRNGEYSSEAAVSMLVALLKEMLRWKSSCLPCFLVLPNVLFIFATPHTPKSKGSIEQIRVNNTASYHISKDFLHYNMWDVGSYLA